MTGTETDFNDRHSELRFGEVFLRNDIETGFARVKAVLPSARLGKVAYNIHGSDITEMMGLKPIFVLRDELEAAGGPLRLEVRYAELAENRRATLRLITSIRPPLDSLKRTNT